MEDVSDLGDVVDAINKLCDTMKTSYNTEDVEAGDKTPVDSDSVVNDENQQQSILVDVSQINEIETTSNYFSLGSTISSSLSSEINSGPIVTNESNEISRSSLPAVPAVPPRLPKRFISTEESAQKPVIDPEEIITRTFVSPEEIFQKVSIHREEVIHRVVTPETSSENQRSEVTSEIWSDTSSQILPAVDDETAASDTDGGAAHCEPTSEMYYTASSEISVVSDEIDDKLQEEHSKEKKECVTAGHVAAMRERFESMTRTNTPDFLRSSSPSLDVLRNITPSPDRLG